MTEELHNDQVLPIIKGRDIIVISLSHWDTKIGSNARNLSLRFAKHNRVLYVNYPITRKTFMTSKPESETAIHCDIIRNKGEQMKEVGENLWVYYPDSIIESVKWLPLTSMFKAANYINNRRYANDIKKAISQLGFKDFIIFNDMDIYNGFYLKELLKPSMYIYYFKDFLQGFSYWKKHATVMEPELIKKIDAVVCNSTYYTDYCLGLTPESYYIGQGCDFSRFVKKEGRPVPEELQSLKGPVIGYVGVVYAERLDERIIDVMAKANPGWNIVMVGPLDESFEKSHLQQYPNVHFLGWRSLDDLADYVEAFDVCINPQLVNHITRGNYPLKIDEYLAMGKPVVATRTKAMKLFEAYTYLADAPEEYPALIQKAFDEHSPEKEKERMAFARKHTWENCVNEIYKVIEKSGK